MNRAIRLLCYFVASLAISIPVFWGNPMQTAFPPSLKESEKIVQEVKKTATPINSLDSRMVSIDSDLLHKLSKVALLSRKELQRSNRDEAIYAGMLLLTGILLLTFLIQTEDYKAEKSNKPAH